MDFRRVRMITPTQSGPPKRADSSAQLGISLSNSLPGFEITQAPPEVPPWVIRGGVHLNTLPLLLKYLRILASHSERRWLSTTPATSTSFTFFPNQSRVTEPSSVQFPNTQVTGLGDFALPAVVRAGAESCEPQPISVGSSLDLPSW